MLREDIKNALLTTRLIQFLEPEELDMLTVHSKILLFSPGDVILAQGTKCEGLYIILEGKVLVTAKILGEGITHIANLEHGNFIGEISLIEKGPCATSAIADTEVKCFYISSRYFEMLSVFFPSTKYQLSRIISTEVCDRIKIMHDKIAETISRLDMVKKSFLGNVIQSLSHCESINFSELNIDIDIFRKLSVFNEFSKEEYDELIEYFEPVNAVKNCTLISETESEPMCYIVLRGAVQSSIIYQNKIAKLSVLGPTRLFCNIAVMGNTLSSLINYTACERVLLLKISAQNLELLHKSNLQLWYKFFDLLSKAIVGLERDCDKLFVRLNSELYNYV